MTEEPPFVVEAWKSASYALSPALADELRRTGLVRVEIDSKPGHYTLRAGSKVGVAVGPGWELRVVSHLDIENLMFLLCYARSVDGWKDALAHFDIGDSLLSSIAWGFASAAEAALQQGVIQGYTRVDERSPVLRGRVRVGAQLASGGMPMPLEISHDEYSIDTPENRLLCAAARILSRLPLVHLDARRRLNRVTGSLRMLDAMTTHRDLSMPPITRLNRHYESALILADLVVRGCSVEAGPGAVKSLTFEFELHTVFEQFLETALEPHVNAAHLRLYKQVPGRSLDHEGKIKLRPDLALHNGAEWLAVLDAKFKHLDGGLTGDAYQMLAYLLEFGPERGYLVSAQGAESTHTILAAGKQIMVRPVDLAQAPERILANVEALSREILLADRLGG